VQIVVSIYLLQQIWHCNDMVESTIYNNFHKAIKASFI
jgi:hypothetical protein